VVAQIVLLGLFLLTAAAVTTRPLAISEGWWPLAAGAVALVLGVIPASMAVRGIASSLDVLAFFAGLLLLAWVLRGSGALDRLLDAMEAWSGSDARRLLGAVALATATTTVLLSNDAAALVLAPAVLDRLVRRGLPLAPFVVTMAFVANAASLVLPISNPVNLLILDRAGIPLTRYLAEVTPAALVGLMVTLGGCLLLSVGSNSGTAVPEPRARPGFRIEGWRRGSLLALVGLLLVADAICVWSRSPVGPPTLVAGLTAVALVWHRGTPAELRSQSSWSVLALVTGFSVLAAGLEHSSLLASAAGRIAAGGPIWLAALASGAATAVISSVINNLPAALLVTSALAAAHHLGSLVLTSIVGADLGPNLAPFGSLSTILILAAVRQRNETVPWWPICRLGLVLGPLALLPTIGMVALGR